MTLCAGEHTLISAANTDKSYISETRKNSDRCYATTAKQITMRSAVAMQSLQESIMQQLRKRETVFPAWSVLTSDKWKDLECRMNEKLGRI
jgi:hypothetical protein